MLQGDLPGDLFRKLLGSNVQTGRLIAGATRSLLGNWTNWPPHEHAAMLEEIYVYVDSRHRLFGLQLVYMDEISPAEIEVVREGGAVLLPAGYHPDVSIPGSTFPRQHTVWQQIVPSPSSAPAGKTASNAHRFYVDPYNPNTIYIMDDSAIKRSDDGGATWEVDTSLDNAITENHRYSYTADYSVIKDIIFVR